MLASSELPDAITLYFTRHYASEGFKRKGQVKFQYSATDYCVLVSSGNNGDRPPQCQAGGSTSSSDGSSTTISRREGKDSGTSVDRERGSEKTGGRNTYIPLAGVVLVYLNFFLIKCLRCL